MVRERRQVRARVPGFLTGSSRHSRDPQVFWLLLCFQRAREPFIYAFFLAAFSFVFIVATSLGDPFGSIEAERKPDGAPRIPSMYFGLLMVESYVSRNSRAYCFQTLCNDFARQ